MRIPSTLKWKDDTVELFFLNPTNVTNDYVNWLNDSLVNRFLESRFRDHSENSTRQFVEICIESPSTLLLGIRSINLQGKHVGNIKVGPIIRDHGRAEIGILIGEKDAWGKGIATAAIRLIKNISRDELGLRKLTASCYVSNVGSQMAFLRAGFYIAGQREAHYMLDGKPEASMLMDCLLGE